ncbi:MAG: TrkA family potassium uptake protein [Clostridiales bacterium]|nr:TrkA family potassium uptake protein [Clostridiales bacterium]
MKKTYVVIGLGKFGTAVAERLYELDNEVLAIDECTESVQRIENKVTYAVVADARDENVLRSLGVKNYDCAIVAIGTDLAASVITTLNLKELGVPQVICKATDETQKRALEKIGADRVLIPEREIGIKLAQTISSTSILDFIELSREYGIAELPTPAHWAGKTLRELNVRAKYGVNIIALKSGSKVNVSPAADAVLQADAVLVVVGTNEQLAKLKS